MNHLGSVAALLVALAAGQVRAQDSVLPGDQEVAVLEACVEAASAEARDLAICRGILAGPCLGARGSEQPSVADRAICLQYEEFAWKLAGLRAGTTYLSIMEGREGFEKDTYLAELESQNAALRERCFRFPKGQELMVVACMLDGAVLQLAEVRHRIEEAGN